MKVTNEYAGKNKYKKGAWVCLLLQAFTVAGSLFAIFMTRLELVSPLIPEATIATITKSIVWSAQVNAGVLAINLVLYFRRYYFTRDHIGAGGYAVCSYIE